MAITDFFECEFPTDISFLAQGGPTWNTVINESYAGAESRVITWSASRNKYTVDLQNRPIAEYQLVQNFFQCVSGQAVAFRFFDYTDFEAVGQVLGYGDSTTVSFQLVKEYQSGNRVYTRQITKPIDSTIEKFDGTFCQDSLVVYINGVAQENDVDYVLDPTTGIITFADPPAGSPPVIVSADFEFHIPVRFASDEIKGQVEEAMTDGAPSVVSWTQIELIEVRDI